MEIAFATASFVLLTSYFILIYNNLVSAKHRIRRAWANIDVILKQRHDEIPKLIEVSKEYMQYEQDILQKITDARAKVSMARCDQNIMALGIAEQQLRMGFQSLIGVSEKYPELKANKIFQSVTKRISELEIIISDRRIEYNETVNHYNIRIEQFPDCILAKQFQFYSEHLLTFEHKNDIDIQQTFRGP